MNKFFFCSLPLLGEKIPTAGNCGVILNSLSQCLSLVDTVTLYKTKPRSHYNVDDVVIENVEFYVSVHTHTASPYVNRRNMSHKSSSVEIGRIILILLPCCMECRRGLAMRIMSVRLFVCPSVCLSVERVICDKTKESCARILIPHERPFTLVL